MLNPIGLEYLEYSKEEALNATQTNMQLWEEAYAKAAVTRSDYISNINEFMISEDAEQKALQLLNDDCFSELCRYDYDMYRYRCLVCISQIEISIGVSSVLSKVKTLNEGVLIYQTANFFLWRIELGHMTFCDGSVDCFKDQYQLSYLFWGEMICSNGIYDKLLVAKRLFEYLIRHREKKDGYLFLFYLADKMDKSIDVIIEFTQLLLDMDEWELGESMLLKVQDPPMQIKQLQHTLSERIPKLKVRGMDEC